MDLLLKITTHGGKVQQVPEWLAALLAIPSAEDVTVLLASMDVTATRLYVCSRKGDLFSLRQCRVVQDVSGNVLRAKLKRVLNLNEKLHEFTRLDSEKPDGARIVDDALDRLVDS